MTESATPVVAHPLRILMIRGEYGDHGPGTQSLTLGRALARRGHHVEYASSGGVLVSEIRREFTHHLIPQLSRERRDPVHVMMAILRLRHLLIVRDIDLVHSHNAAVGFLSWIAQRSMKRRVAVVSHVRGVEIRRSWAWRNLIYLSYPAEFLAVSAYTKDCLKAVGVPPHRIEVTYNGVDLDQFNMRVPRSTVRTEFGISDGQLAVGTVAAMTELKGHDILIRAAALLRKYFPHARYLIVGDGPPRARHEALARQLGVADICRFAGLRRDIPSIMRALDVFTLPSKGGEMFPNVLLEASSVGTPWVASRLAGVPEFSDSERNGLLCEPGDPVSLARQLARLLSNQGLRARLGADGISAVHERYSIDRVIDRVEESYARALARQVGLR